MKVIIVDDERQIREGIKSLIDFEGLGCQVVGEGKNGTEALELIFAYKPDLCIIDIRMPVMNGIEVIERCYERQVSTKFILLSGYGEFDYAKRAMACDVKDYLLKPIEESQLLELIKAHCISLEQHLKDQKVLKEQWLKGWIKNNEGVEDLEAVNTMYEMKLPWKSYQLIVMDVRKPSSDMVEADVSQLIEKVIKHHGYLMPVGQQYVALIKNMVVDHEKGLGAYLRETLEEAGFVSRIVLSSLMYQYQLVHQGYREAEHMLGNYFIQQPKNGLSKAIKASTIQEPLILDEEEWFVKLAHSVLTNHKATIRKLLEMKLRKMLEDLINEKEAIGAYTHLYVKLVNALSLETHLEKEAYLNPKTLAALYDMETLGCLHDYFMTLVNEIGEAIHRNDGSSVVNQLKTYIENHYAMDLKIETMATFFGYNSAYLGKQFKKETGLYYNRFLDYVRIEAAKNKLINTEDKIYEIAQAVGYNDADYFTSKFKKMVGMTPNTYRK